MRAWIPPETLHHWLVRSVELRTVFGDDADRAAFLARLAAVAERRALTVYAWALLPTHAQGLLWMGARVSVYQPSEGAAQREATACL